MERQTHGATVCIVIDISTYVYTSRGKNLERQTETWKGKRMAPAGIQQDSHTTSHDASQLGLMV